MKTIELSKGMVAIVDDADHEQLIGTNWFASAGHQTYYAVCAGGRELMHRFLMKPGKNEEVDHINGNGLDNRRENLRVCSKSQQRCNQGKRREKNGASSRFKGVCYDKSRGQWAFSVRFKGAIVRGRRDSEIAAALCYDHHARQMHGPFARLNFPYGAG